VDSRPFELYHLVWRSLRLDYFFGVNNLIEFILPKRRFQQFRMVQLYNLYFLLSLIKHINDRWGALGKFCNLTVSKIDVFLFIQNDVSFGCEQVKQFVGVSLSLFINSSVGNQRLIICLWVEHKKVKVISLLFVDND
jgi:hypothetical protein